MDNICEQLVVKERTRGDTVKAVIIIAVMSIISGGGIFFMLQGWTILIFLIAGVDFGGIWLLKGIGVEYEYIVTNNELDIDKIVGKRKRTRLITVDLSKTIDLYGYSEKDGDSDTTVFATSGVKEDASCLIVQHSDYGKVNIIFDPNESTKEAIVREFPYALRTRMKQDGK